MNQGSIGIWFEVSPSAAFLKCYPIGSMYGIFTHIYHTFNPNVGRYTIHGSYGLWHYRNFNLTFHDFILGGSLSTITDQPEIDALLDGNERMQEIYLHCDFIGKKVR